MSTRAGIARAATLLITAVACALIVGCASRGTLKKTVGNDTREIDRLITAAGRQPIERDTFYNVVRPSVVSVPLAPSA